MDRTKLSPENQAWLGRMEKILQEGNERQVANIMAVCALGLMQDLKNNDQKRDVGMGLTTFLLDQGALWFIRYVMREAKKEGFTSQNLAEIFALAAIEIESAAEKHRTRFINLCQGLEEELKK